MPSPLLPPDYRPSDDEEFMNDMQAEYFRQRLLLWREEVFRDSNETLMSRKSQNLAKPEMTDRATLETDRATGARTPTPPRSTEGRRMRKSGGRTVRSWRSPCQHKKK